MTKKITSPTVTIICPSHRRVDNLSKLSYDSMLSQDYDLTSINICVNGVSKEEYCEIENYLRDNNKNNFPIVLSHHLSPLSPGSARRVLLSTIKSDYVLFLDSDDVANKDLISKKIRYSLDFELDVVLCSANTFTNYDNFVKNSCLGFRSYLIPYILLSLFKSTWLPLAINLIPNSGTLIKTSKFSRLLRSYPIAPHEDFIFYSNLLDLNPSIGLLLKPLISYNISTHTTSGNKLKSKIWHYRALKFIKPHYSRFTRLVITALGPPLMFIISIVNALITLPTTFVVKRT